VNQEKPEPGNVIEEEQLRRFISMILKPRKTGI